MSVNYWLFALWDYWPDNQPMVDKYPHPKGYRSFALWMAAMLMPAYGIKKKDFAEAMGVSPQSIKKYREGSKPGLNALRGLHDNYGIDLQALRDLVDEVEMPPTSRSANLTTKSEMGARVGRKWEELDDPVRTQILDLIESSLTMQRMMKREKEKV